MNKDIIVSVIVPVYNVEQYLDTCLDSLIAQTMSKNSFEVILVDDGSPDSSGKICDEYSQKYNFIKTHHLKNSGVSTARNYGIDNAVGKYIMFLDSDDYLSENAIESIANFFETHFDETDVVTYNQMIVKNDEEIPSTHFRYKYLEKSGVYDLTDSKNMYILQTHMNICVKNRFENNYKFDTNMIFHEDQKYIITNLSEKNKLGFCMEATYYYLMNSNGATRFSSQPYYIFEATMAMWEHFLSKENVPKYVQAYFFHDFHWKLRADMLWPYHYDDERFAQAKERICNLLRKVDDDVILDFPGFVYAHKAYVFQLKYGEKMNIYTGKSFYQICCDKDPLITLSNIEIHITKFQLRNRQLTMIGVIKCIAGNFTDDIKLALTYNGNTEYLPLRDSSLSVFASQTKTSNFRLFTIKKEIAYNDKLDFSVELNQQQYPIFFTFAAMNPFNRGLNRLSYVCEGYKVSLKDASITFTKATCFNNLKFNLKSIRYIKRLGFRNTMTRLKAPKYKKQNRIWIYCDSSKTVKDNAYFQFLHDVKNNDGITRYYVCNPETNVSGWFDDSLKDNLLVYGSFKHRLCCLSAEKMITSFLGQRDILPYLYGAIKYFCDLTNFDIIYLQHGVLHANLPTMYSLDRFPINKEVISTKFEEKNFIDNYCFTPDFLINCGMPRYNRIDKNKKSEKKILFAPSWRRFLAIPDGKGSWLPNDKAFLNSEFYKNTSAFLTDKRLIKALEDNGYVLNFKLHPNFKFYDHLYNVDGKNIRIADKNVDEFSYKLFITDFSSFVFDFVYLKRPILYFVPDMELFKAGFNHYRKLDIPFEEGFGEVSTNAAKAVDDVIALVNNSCIPAQKYIDRMDGMFFDIEDHQEALYEALLKE